MPVMAAQIPVPWDYLQENLVTLSEIARRLRLNRVTASAWAKTYDNGAKYYEDWPDPVLTFEAHSGSGTSDFYWWPDVRNFCERHEVVAGRGMPRGRPRKDPEQPLLLTRTEMAARSDVHISTMMTWIDRYRDFPAPARPDAVHPLWCWPDVKDYLAKKGLPRMRRSDAAADAAARDTRIMATLQLYPDGLTDRELTDLLTTDEPATERFGQPTAHAVSVRINDRLRRLEADGKVTRARRPSARRGTTIWLPAPAKKPWPT